MGPDMTDPQPAAPQAPPLYPIEAGTGIASDPAGNFFVMLKLTDGTVSAEFRIDPASADHFADGIAGAIKQAGRQARAAARRSPLLVPPGATAGLIVPGNGGGPRG